MHSARPPAIMHGIGHSGIVVAGGSERCERRAKQVRMRIQAIATCMGGRVRAVVSTAVVLPTYIIATMHAACSHA